MPGYNIPKVAACATAQLSPHPAAFCTSFFHKKSNFFYLLNKKLILAVLNFIYDRVLLIFKLQALSFMCREQQIDAFSLSLHTNALPCGETIDV